MDTNSILIIAGAIIFIVLVFAAGWSKDFGKEGREARRAEQERAMNRPITHTFENHVVTYKLDRSQLANAMHGIVVAMAAGQQIDKILKANPDADLRNYEREMMIKIIRQERGPGKHSAEITVLGD